MKIYICNVIVIFTTGFCNDFQNIAFGILIVQALQKSLYIEMHNFYVLRNIRLLKESYLCYFSHKALITHELIFSVIFIEVDVTLIKRTKTRASHYLSCMINISLNALSIYSIVKWCVGWRRVSACVILSENALLHPWLTFLQTSTAAFRHALLNKKLIRGCVD